jgi:hypothetical protein
MDPPAWEFSVGLKILHNQKIIFLQNVTQGLKLGGSFETHGKKMNAYRIFVGKSEGK